MRLIDKLGFFVLGGVVLAAGPTLAQSNPSADSIINSLRPRAGMTDGTRGIRPLNPSPNAAHPAEPHAGRPAVHAESAAHTARPGPSDEDVASVNLSVQFATNSAVLTPAATHTLDELGRALSSNTLATYHFRIEGHTDTVGSPDLNQALSEQRAKAVVDYLVSNFGIDRSRLDPVGFGATRLLIKTGNNVPDARNRRVTVVNLGT